MKPRIKATLKILAKYGGVLLGMLLILQGIKVLNATYQSEERIDMMLAQMSEQSGMGAELTSDYLRDAMGLDEPWKPDWWPSGDSGSSYTAPSTSSSYSSSSSSASAPSSSSYPSSSSSSSYSSRSSNDDTIGLAVGGAKDTVNFRENIRNGYLPQPTDITTEGLYYDYYFDTGLSGTCTSLFCPSYTTAVTRDPLSHETEYYLSIGLNSGLKEDYFKRKPLNLVIVLDVSSSMSGEFDQYYYDSDSRSNDYSIMRKNKIESAKDAVLSILDQLEEGDRFALVCFNTSAWVEIPFETVGDVHMPYIEREVMQIRATGSTNLDRGMELASDLLYDQRYRDRSTWENRIMVLTDAEPNTGDTSGYGLVRDVKRNAEDALYTTFIGIGVDFNSELIEQLTDAKGANYYTVGSTSEFNRRIEEEFDFMVTPLVFDLELRFESKGWVIDQIYGNPQADKSSGSLMHIDTLFPSKSSGGNVKGGLVLLKLRRIYSEEDGRIFLRVDYEDRYGEHDYSQSLIEFDTTYPEHFDNTGIRKGVLLARYGALLKNWMSDERYYLNSSDRWYPSIDEDSGITETYHYRQNWEQRSVRLRVSRFYRTLFENFAGYFEDEMNAIGDYSLDQELDILDFLIDYH